jgi:integrase/recombinase XerD
MANPRLEGWPVLNAQKSPYRVTPDQIHDYEYELKNAVERLGRDPHLRPADQKLIEAFLKHIKAQDVSTGRLAKYVNTLHTASAMMRVPWRRARRKDIEDLMTKLVDREIVGKSGEVRRYSAETMADFRQIVKRFQKFVRYGDTDLETPWPDEVRWLHKSVKESDRRAPLFFTDPEVEAMVKAVDTLRDKAFLAAYGEMGGRPSEFLLLRIGDLAFDDDGVVVTVRQGKTGWRTLRLISSAAYLADYVSTHTFRNDPNAPLWVTTSTNHLNEPMSWVAADRIVKAAGAKAGVNKGRCHMYMFRHGSATRNAKFLTDAELRLMFGWSPASKVPSRYIHLSGGDLDAKYRAVYGSGKPVEPAKPQFAPVICPRCQEKGSPGMRFCPKCAAPLEEAERAKLTVREEETRNEIAELRKLVERSLSPPASGEGRGSSPGQSASV